MPNGIDKSFFSAIARFVVVDGNLIDRTNLAIRFFSYNQFSQSVYSKEAKIKVQ